MAVSAAKLNRSFSGVHGHRMCLLFSQILISANRDAPAFSEAGTLFYSPILKKRQENIRCMVEGFLKTAKNFRTKAQKVSVCYMEGKSFD